MGRGEMSRVSTWDGDESKRSYDEGDPDRVCALVPSRQNHDEQFNVRLSAVSTQGLDLDATGAHHRASLHRPETSTLPRQQSATRTGSPHPLPQSTRLTTPFPDRGRRVLYQTGYTPGTRPLVPTAYLSYRAGTSRDVFPSRTAGRLDTTDICEGAVEKGK